MRSSQPITIQDMRRVVAEKAQRAEPEEEIQCRVALVLGPDFPPDAADLYCAFAYRKGVTVERIPCTDPRIQAIEGGDYQGAPSGVIRSGGQPQQVFLLKPEYVKEFDFIEAVNFFDYQGGMVCAMSCYPEEIDRALAWGP